MNLKRQLPAMIMVCGMLVAVEDKAFAQNANPLLSDYKTPFGVPDFEKIKPEHFMPAFEEGMKLQQQRIAAITMQRSVPTFENTISALEGSGEALGKVSTVFFNLTSANTNAEIEKISQQIAPKLSQHSDDIYLNAELFKRVKTVYDNRSKAKLTPEQTRLLEKTYKAFVRSGANLDLAKQTKMREINKELSVLTVKFGQNLLKETNGFELIIDNKEDLAGLPESAIAAAAQSAKGAGKEGKWRFTLHNPSVMPFLQYADNRQLRKKMYNAYINRCNNNNELDNKEVLSKIVSLRADKASLLGYSDHASYVLEETMAKSPDKAYELLNGLWQSALPVAKREASEMQSLMNRTNPGQQLEAWDWSYYADKVRKDKYNFNAEEMRPYFKLENVREGIFEVTRRLYGLSFTEIKDIPKYHQDVIAYEVKEVNGRHVGVFYMDFFPRASKRSGAWMTSYRKQAIKDGKMISPVVSIVCNFSQPTTDKPALLTADEVETFFHEFGHALHGLLSNVKFESLSGTSVPRDFVELPSQIMENWAFEPEVLGFYAKHYQTGELIPTALVEKMKKASKFNQGFATVEYLAASLLDMGYHTTPAGKQINTTAFEKEQMDKIGLIGQIAPRYRSTYFQHIFSGGYSAGYYSYIWSEVLDSDAFAAFKETGNLFDPKTAASFRKNVLEKGGTEDPMTLYKSFRGAEPNVKYLLEKRGLDKAL
ncbi:M3 family metallopeptidase [Solitalea canadensis]|uniref:Zn-dependent oligopeptidase n=1 Tax=Solitalea canadensis (strain ATCC 29591 / DSM 3403 / JCM 21819 / LMG 8368 / NBRC 15130 / NCIMB 12057 / USAM 9D) TaxID=929556 RepID=H8KM52_SOLCM|nr:M3 family metallopeptidase [Solitalea canadensis]AFD08974.1 Zn-dependent oligopeptidase [Solitalea canadensis DSM 3403]